MQREYGIEVRWRAFPLHPDTPEEGMTLEELFRGRLMDIGAMMAGLQRTAAGLGLPMGERTRTYNTRKAQELGLWAMDSGRGDPFHQAAFRAYFVHGRNLAKRDVLADLASAAGLDSNAALEILETGQYAGAVDRDWDLSRRIGITGVPAFVMDREVLAGAKPHERLEQWVRSHGALPR